MYINHIVSELQTYFLSFFCHLYSLGIIPKPAPSKHQNSQKKILKWIYLVISYEWGTIYFNKSFCFFLLLEDKQYFVFFFFYVVK